MFSSGGSGSSSGSRLPRSHSQSTHLPAASSHSPSAASASASPAAASTTALNEFDKLVQRVELICGGASGSPSTGDSKSAKFKLEKSLKLDDSATDILFELEKALVTVEKSLVHKHQSSLEKLFFDKILPKCENYQTRILASSCMTKLFEFNTSNVSNAYHELLKFLEHKEHTHKIIGLQLMANLTKAFGSQFMLSIPEVLGILYKLAKNRDEVVLKQLILDVIAAYYEGTSGSARSCGSSENTCHDMIKILTRFSADKSPQIRKKTFFTARAVIYYSIDCRELDSILGLLFKSLANETENDVRFAMSESGGDMLSFALRKDWKKIHDILAKMYTGKTAPKKVYGETKSIEDIWILMEKQMLHTNMKSSASSMTSMSNLALRTCYVQMLSRALRNNCAQNAFNIANGSLRIGCEGSMGSENTSSNDGMIEDSNAVSQITRWLSQLSKAKFNTTAGSSTVIIVGGYASTSAFHLPLRDGGGTVDLVIDQNIRQMYQLISTSLTSNFLPFQSERSLEAIGKSVVSFLSGIIKASGSTVANLNGDLNVNYQVLLCFQILSFIFHRLGLAIEYLDLKDQCLEVLLFFLPHPQYQVRIACASCFRSLARAASPALATWLSVLYKIVVMQLVEVTDSQDNATGAAKKAAVDIDPAPYYSLNGHIAALAAIVGVIPEAPCGVPSVILDSIYDAARKLLTLIPDTPTNPQPTNHVHLHSLVEGGWLLLNSLISLGFEWNTSRLNSLFVLWRASLSKKPVAGRQKQEDINLDLRVRTKALLALRSFTQVMRFKLTMTLVASSNTWTPSPILKAIVIFLRNTFSLLKALTSEKNLDPSVTLSLSNLKSVLMDLFAALPPQSYQSIFVPLLHIVVSEFTSKNPPLTSELNRILTKADSNLNAPNLSQGTPGGYEESLIRFVDLSDPSDTNPILSPSTGLPLPSPASFYEIYSGGGQVVADFSWDWGLRAQVHTETLREIANATGASAAAAAHGNNNGNHPGTPHTPPAVSSPTTVDPSSLTVSGDDSLGDKVLDGLSGEGFDDAAPLAVDPEGVDPESSLASRPLWSSLRNHLDRLGAGVTHHAAECFEVPAVRSVNACVRLFGSLYADQSSTHQEQLAKHFLAIVTKAKSMSSLHSNIVTNAATALLAIARDLAERDAGLRSQAALDTLLAVAAELMAVPNPLVRRAVGEMLGLLVRVESDELLNKLFATLQNHLHSKDQHAVMTAVFSLGCVHRYGGAMKTMRYLPFTVAALQSLGRDFSEPFRLWILHSLWLAIDTGGLSFSAYVQPTLAILTAHASHDVDARAANVTQAIGRIITAVMGALGPDVATGAPGVDKFLNLWYHLRSLPVTDAGAATQVECVSVLYQLAMWSSVAEHADTLPMLIRALSSEEEELRRTAVRTLLQCGEKDPSLLLKHGLEKRIVSLLDAEQSSTMTALVKHVINTWLAAAGSDSAAHESADASLRYRLFDVCKRAVVGGHRLPSDGQIAAAQLKAEVAAKSKGKGPAAAAADDGKDEDDEDDDGNILSSSSAGASKKKDSGSGGSSSSSSGNGERSNLDFIHTPSETRWQTKSFALDCLLTLLKVTQKSLDAAHEFDLAFARKHQHFPLQYAVQQLPDLLTVANLATSSVYDMLRIKGTSCMRGIVDVFSDVLDPDAIDEDGTVGKGTNLLLQLYSAQVTSALSQSMKNKSETILSAPQLRAKACELAVVYLSSGVTTDPIVFSRMLKLLLAPLLSPQELLTSLNNQFDGNMATLVVLSHLHALASLHHIVLENKAAIAAHFAQLNSRKAKSSKPLTPKFQAILAIKETLSSHFPLLSLHYFQALKDYILVSTLNRKEIQKLKGFYFDGATTSNPLPVYLNYWESFLKNISLCLNATERSDEDVFGSIIASDGSVGSELARRELLAICLGVIGNSLNLIAVHEARTASGASMHGANSTLGARATSDKRSANLDASTLSKADRERDSSCILTCVYALTGVLSTKHFTDGQISTQILHEILPLLGWNLAHRPAGAEVATLAKRQTAVMHVFEHLINVVLKQIVEDDSKLAAFLASAQRLKIGSDETEPASSAAATATPASSLLDLFYAISEAFSFAVHQYLPTFGGSTSHSIYLANLQKLSDSTVYLTADVSSTLQQILSLLPSYLDLVSKVTATSESKESESESGDNAKDELRTSQLCFSLNLCLHYIRKGTLELSNRAVEVFQSLLLRNYNSSDRAQLLPPPILTQQLSQQIRSVLMNPLPLNTDFRASALLACLFQLVSYDVLATAADEDLTTAIQSFTTVWFEFQRHPGSRFRLIALQALHLHVLQPLPSSAFETSTATTSVLPHAQRCIRTLLSQVAEVLLNTLKENDINPEESSAAAECCLDVFHCLQATTEASNVPATPLADWLALILPLLVNHLAHVPTTVVSVLALATQHPQLFKSSVALLPLELRSKLQGCVVSMSPAQQAAAMAKVAAIQAALQSKAVDSNAAAASVSAQQEGNTKKKTKSKKESYSSSSSSSAAASSPTIALSMDFSNFKKK